MPPKKGGEGPPLPPKSHPVSFLLWRGRSPPCCELGEATPFGEGGGGTAAKVRGGRRDFGWIWDFWPWPKARGNNGARGGQRMVL